MTQQLTPLETIKEFGLDPTLIRPLFHAIPSIKLLFDPEEAEVLRGKLTTRQFCDQLSNTYRLLAEILNKAHSTEELKANISAMQRLLKDGYDENMRRIDDQTREIRRTLHSVKMGFDNAPKGTIRLFPIDREAFVDRPDDAYWSALTKQIRKLFKKYDLKNAQAPCYISFPFAIDTPDAARKIAGFAEEVVGMAMMDIKSFKNAKDVVAYMRNSFQIMSSNEQGAHLMISGTHGYKKGVYEKYGEEQLLALPLGPALMGRMLSMPIGASPSSLRGVGLVGLDGVAVSYDEETTESSAFASHGVIEILDNGKIQSTATCCNGDLPVYNSFPLMDIFIMVQRSLIAFANEYAHSNWGKKEVKAFTDQLLSYFNGLYDDTGGDRVIEEPVTREMIGIMYNEQAKTVFVSIPIKYKGVVSKFRFTLVSRKDQPFDQIKKRKI